MPVCKIDRAPSETQLVVRGSLTDPDVHLIQEAIALRPTSGEVVVDLRAAAPLEPSQLLALARVAAGARNRLRLLGLTATGERMLALLGAPGTTH
jgi:hypothetical protein